MTHSTSGFNADRIASIADDLFEFPDTKMARPRKEGGWSRKEILGHLIDSASVNHQRIIEAQITGSIVFNGYAHEDWVRLQGYRDMDWDELVTMWCSFNMQIYSVIERITPEVLDELHEKHSYDRTAFRELSADEPSSLGYLIEDYFAHLRYHLDQICS